MVSSNPACLLSIGTALPPHELKQTEAKACFEQHIAPAMDLQESVTDWVTRRFEAAGIQSRYTVCPNLFHQFAGEAAGLYGDANNKTPSAEERNTVWAQEIPKLSVMAAARALSQLPAHAKITHVVFHSCTGFMAPGVENHIIDALKLQHVKRKLAVNFMGCFGAFTALSVATDICRAEPGSHVLCVCAELCSLHMGPGDQRSAQMGVVLFGDGAGAFVVGPGAEGDWAVIGGQSFKLPPDSRDEMTWKPTNSSYCMWLGKDIPRYFGKALRTYWKKWFKGLFGHCDPTLVEWAIHPGSGPIVNMVRDPRIGICGPNGSLTQDHVEHSLSVLRDIGNVSSASIIFVLQRLLQQATKDDVFMLGFGPGLTVEFNGLHRLPKQAERSSCTLVSQQDEQASIEAATITTGVFALSYCFVLAVLYFSNQCLGTVLAVYVAMLVDDFVFFVRHWLSHRGHKLKWLKWFTVPLPFTFRSMDAKKPLLVLPRWTGFQNWRNFPADQQWLVGSLLLHPYHHHGSMNPEKYALSTVDAVQMFETSVCSIYIGWFCGGPVVSLATMWNYMVRVLLHEIAAHGLFVSSFSRSSSLSQLHEIGKKSHELHHRHPGKFAYGFLPVWDILTGSFPFADQGC